MRQRGKRRRRRRKWWVGPKKIEEQRCHRVCEETVEMVQWRNISQEEINNMWEKLSGTMEQEVLEKYQVEETNKAHTRVSHQNGGSSREQRNINLESGHNSERTVCNEAKAGREVRLKRKR